jgi:hypothetical protein
LNGNSEVGENTFISLLHNESQQVFDLAWSALLLGISKEIGSPRFLRKTLRHSSHFDMLQPSNVAIAQTAQFCNIEEESKFVVQILKPGETFNHFGRRSLSLFF